jgi:hypothetical protein
LHSGADFAFCWYRLRESRLSVIQIAKSQRAALLKWSIMHMRIEKQFRAMEIIKVSQWIIIEE